MKHLFLPAAGPYITESPKSGPFPHPIHWFDKNSPVYYPAALASHALWRDTKLPAVDKNEFYMFGDSGGYTVVTQPDYKTDPIQVLKWQILNCTCGVMLDIPPYRPGSAIQFTGSAAVYWDESLQRSVQNVQRGVTIYKGYLQSELPTGVPRFEWWGVVQGEERTQMEEWHGKISEVHEFKGWALAPKPSTDLLSCTRYMKFAHDKGIKKVHILQVTAEKTVALILALGVLSGQFDLVTYDSASAMRCAVNRSMIIADGFGQRYIKESRQVQVDEFCESCLQRGTDCKCEGNENTCHEFMLTCPCQACEWYRQDMPVSNAYYPHILLMHNHLTMVKSFDLTFAEAQKDPDRIIRWAAGNEYGKIMREWEGQTHAKVQRRPVSLLDRLASKSSVL